MLTGALIPYTGPTKPSHPPSPLSGVPTRALGLPPGQNGFSLWPMHLMRFGNRAAAGAPPAIWLGVKEKKKALALGIINNLMQQV